MVESTQVKNVQELLHEFYSLKKPCQSYAIPFSNVGEKDVYNITAPFLDRGEYVIAGRVEDRDNEDSSVVFFVERSDVWVPREGERIFASLQDPFITFIHGELIFGGVEIWPSFGNRDALEYRTVFYRGAHVADLRLFAVGPQSMKDIRLVELEDHQIGVFTRPKGDLYGGPAKIGFSIISSLDELTPRLIIEAEILPNLFQPDEWAGVNELHLLGNGKIGVLGHIAYFSEDGMRHYYAMAFVFDYQRREISPIKIIAARDCVDTAVQAKRSDLQDILFAGGLVLRDDGQADLYTGVNDCEAYVINLPDPFSRR